ncbi:oxidoreductase [Oscillospiraceae bacterium]|nr:oxidoreductase [Oscillospiraceae bacterium]
MRWIFDVDPEKCSACGACAIACIDQNDIAVERTEMPFRSVFRVESGEGVSYASLACMHCEDAPCVMACPSGCLKKDPDTGLTLYDTTNCIGCHSCSMACPYGAPAFGFGDHKMHKCDGCVERVRWGLEPACVRACYAGALKCYTEEAYLAEKRSSSLRKLLGGTCS